MCNLKSISFYASFISQMHIMQWLSLSCLYLPFGMYHLVYNNYSFSIHLHLTHCLAGYYHPIQSDILAHILSQRHHLSRFVRYHSIGSHFVKSIGKMSFIPLWFPGSHFLLFTELRSCVPDYPSSRRAGLLGCSKTKSNLLLSILLLNDCRLHSPMGCLFYSYCRIVYS